MAAALCAVRQRSERPTLDLEKLSGGVAHWLGCSTTTAAAGPGLLDLLLVAFLRSAAPVGDCYSSPASRLATATAALSDRLLLFFTLVGDCYSPPVSRLAVAATVLLPAARSAAPFFFFSEKKFW
ncbi:hypothetical protein HAX54_011423 [Datura stramonium]|uniref:Uncharacterized protein n=1 Tax=Datura stramonium TaxID=4076 RepID=A0ABS8TJW3_DATST|nr:hypothetical protein [Datura stramonium]